MKRFIAVAGNIGVGKSTLVTLLCQRMDREPFYEPVLENPYLADFYKDMNAWAFHSQIFFLTHRLRIHHQLLKHANSAIQDRSVYEDAEVFACNLYRQGLISDRDYSSYRELYLRASVETLLTRIKNRGRDYERQISADYLAQLNSLYEEWIDHFTLCPVLTVPADDLDYVSHAGHLDLIVSKVEDKLMGKEEVIFEPEEVKNSK
jgi:deoxyadenosine/deoxycytidine kinase